MAIDLQLASRTPTTARQMADAATRFVASLDAQQRAQAVFPFAGEERYFWHYTPVPRNGLLLRDMDIPQRLAAYELLATGLSPRGNREVHQIIALEPILDLTEIVEGLPRDWPRDPELYYFSVFGDPAASAPWAWRVGGHHVGLHFTLVERDVIASTPLFFGANPARVNHGTREGLRSLAVEEDLARELVRGLPPELRGLAVVDPVAPADILTTNTRLADPDAALRGIRFAQLDGGSRERLVRLIRYYVERSTEELARQTWLRVEEAGLDPITFAWAGPTEKARGNGHYYAIQGPTFLVEYDNTQNQANHIHSVWRDFQGDWGEDLLAAHFAQSHRG